MADPTSKDVCRADDEDPGVEEERSEIGVESAVEPRSESVGTAGGGRLLMILSTAIAVFLLLATLGLLDWSLPLAGSRSEPGTPTAAGSVGRAFAGRGPKGGAESGIGQGTVAALATELAAGGWPSLALSVEGGGLGIAGAVANEQERLDVVAIAERRLPGVPIHDRLSISSNEPAHVRLDVSQNGLLLEGTVPSRALAEELVTRATDIYLVDQISHQLTVDPAAGTPLAITASGTISDALLLELVMARFSGIVGVDPVLNDRLILEKPSAIERALNSFGEIRFASGSAVILSESAPVLDQVAVILGSSPQMAIEIGGHVEVVDDDETAYRLSQSRADVVRAELLVRGVRNVLLGRGFGRSRIAATDLETSELARPSAIEFRVLG